MLWLCVCIFAFLYLMTYFTKVFQSLKVCLGGAVPGVHGVRTSYKEQKAILADPFQHDAVSCSSAEDRRFIFSAVGMSTDMAMRPCGGQRHQHSADLLRLRDPACLHFEHPSDDPDEVPFEALSSVCRTVLQASHSNRLVAHHSCVARRGHPCLCRVNSEESCLQCLRRHWSYPILMLVAAYLAILILVCAVWLVWKKLEIVRDQL